jgi:hypothetical protein
VIALRVSTWPHSPSTLLYVTLDVTCLAGRNFRIRVVNHPAAAGHAGTKLIRAGISLGLRRLTQGVGQGNADGPASDPRRSRTFHKLSLDTL